MGWLRWLGIVSIGILGAGAAGADVDAEDWRYVQRVHAISEVNKALWSALEDQSAWDPEVARYARKANAMNLAQLQRWRAPRRDFQGFHRDFVAILETIDRFYGAIGNSDWDAAQAHGERIKRQMVNLEQSWQTLAAAFQ